MEGSIFSSDGFLLYATLAFLLSQALLYAARDTIHRGLDNAGQLLAGVLRLAARSCKAAAKGLAERNREVLMESAQAEMEKRLEREFTRIEAGFANDLAQFPDLHGKLDKLVSEVEGDLRASAESPPEAPGWPDAVTAIAEAAKLSDRNAGRALNSLRNMAETADKRALKDYRDAVAKRHKILAAVAPRIKALKSTMSQTLRAVTAAMGHASKIDAHMAHYEKLRRRDGATERAMAASSVCLLVVSAIVLAVAAGGAFVNFHLIALPMSELVPAGTRVAGVPVSTIAALVIVLTEAAAGIFVMEALGITTLFPRMETLSPQQRRLIFAVALAGLFALATIEASLAFLREQIVEADLALKQSLAGADAGAVQQAATSPIPVIGQTVLGFVLPWILAMVAIPLEMFVHSARHIAGRLLALLVLTVGVLLRLISFAVRQVTWLCMALVDLYIVIPLHIERLVAKLRGRPAPPSTLGKPLYRAAGGGQGRLA